MGSNHYPNPYRHSRPRYHPPGNRPNRLYLPISTALRIRFIHCIRFLLANVYPRSSTVSHSSIHVPIHPSTTSIVRRIYD